MGGSSFFSEEGTTQGDPLAMPMYAMATIPLINQLSNIRDMKQVWYADDATAAGSLHSTRQWWNHLVSVGPAFGYYANASKTWLLTKDEHLDRAKTLFQDTEVNITALGRTHLGAALGCKEYIDQFVSDKVHRWTQELLILSNIAPNLTGRPPPNDLERNLLGLPPRLGGLGITNPTMISTGELTPLNPSRHL